MQFGDVKFTVDMFNATVKAITPAMLNNRMRRDGWTPERMESALRTNAPGFRLFCHEFGRSLVPVRVSSTTYAGVVAVIARQFGVPYKAYAGFCLLRTQKGYEEQKKHYMESRENGSNMLATHVYIDVDGEIFEFMNDLESTDIDHIESQIIEEWPGKE